MKGGCSERKTYNVIWFARSLGQNGGCCLPGAPRRVTALHASTLARYVSRFESCEGSLMKIIDVRTTVVGNPWKNWVFVQLLTDEGIVGIGEATGGLSTKPNEAAVHELKPLYLGQDPRDVHAVWDRMHKGLFLGQNAAMSGIEMACWDILGKSLDVPVWRLLGGRQRPRIRAYANGWYQGPRDPTFFGERATAVVARGYSALKFDP